MYLKDCVLSAISLSLTSTGLILLLPVSAALSASIATPVEFSDFSNDAVLINFDFRPDGTSIPGIPTPPFSGTISNPDAVIDDEYSSLGVLFSSVNSGPVAVVATQQIVGISSPNSLIGTSSASAFATGGPILATFVDPLTGLPGTTTQVGAFSLDVDIAPVSFTAFDIQGNEIGETFFAVGGDGASDFAGLRSDAGIASIVINVPRTDFLAIDNFVFEPVTPVSSSIPEPSSSLSLLALGTVATGIVLLQKYRSQPRLLRVELGEIAAQSQSRTGAEIQKGN